MTKVLSIAVIIFYVGCNLVVAKTRSIKEMRDEFVVGQCTVGMVFANLFYTPAWLLKLMRGVVVSVVK